MKTENLCPLCHTEAGDKYELAHTTIWKCMEPTCGLEFADPQLDESNLTRAYTDLYYPGNEHGARFRNTPSSIFHQVFEKLEGQIGNLRGLELLDYGCGRGALMRASLEFGMHPSGIDSDSEARATAASVSRVYGSVDELCAARPGPQFDLISLWTVVEHLRVPWQELADLRALLRPGGWVLISTMDVQCLRARIEGKHWQNYGNPTHLYYFNKRSLSRVVREAGFSNLLRWRIRIRYPQHGILRQWLSFFAFSLELGDGLFYLCRKGYPDGD